MTVKHTVLVDYCVDGSYCPGCFRDFIEKRHDRLLVGNGYIYAPELPLFNKGADLLGFKLPEFIFIIRNSGVNFARVAVPEHSAYQTELHKGSSPAR